MNGKRISSHIAEIVLRVIGSITLVTSLMMVTGAIISYGFPLVPDQKEGMEMFFRYVWAVFILDRVLLIIFEPHHLKTGISKGICCPVATQPQHQKPSSTKGMSLCATAPKRACKKFIYDFYHPVWWLSDLIVHA